MAKFSKKRGKASPEVSTASLPDIIFMLLFFVGKPTEENRQTFGSSPRLQLGDKIADMKDIPLFLEKHRVTIAENQRGQITSSLKVDGEVTMGIVGDVKTALRKAGQFKVNYSAKKRAE